MNKPFIVAEISASHMGSEKRALQLIDAAARAGADAVKFQTWQAGSMAIAEDYRLASGPWAGRPLADLYAAAYTPWEWHETLYAAVRSHRMMPFSSVFDLTSLAFLERLDCPMYKIASFEINDHALIGAAARTGKPLVMSVGMASRWEIAEAVRVAHEAAVSHLTLLSCVSAYPSDLADANLARFHSLGRLACHEVGLSDHSAGLIAPVMAVALGARMIEKHITLSRDAGGLDDGFALEPDEFAGMVHAVRSAAAAMGNGDFGATPQEASSVSLRRSLWWAADVAQGTEVTSAMLMSARPWGCLPPHAQPMLLGQRLAQPVSRGTPVLMEQFE